MIRWPADHQAMDRTPVPGRLFHPRIPWARSQCFYFEELGSEPRACTAGSAVDPQVPNAVPDLGTGRSGNWAIQNGNGLFVGTCGTLRLLGGGSHCSESLCVSPVAARVDNRFIAQLMHDCHCPIYMLREILSSFRGSA
jgi:hypothetical protein